ncbi:MAG: hypothetical protein RLO51_21010 [Thalassobaculum sp.]|uniref:hypothetical protein n=1 Tax=Thalassobaculum sp. TaxID=2022740 RepID=UPI0032EACAEA
MAVWSWTAEYMSLDGMPNGKLRSLAEHWLDVTRGEGLDVPEAAAIDIERFEPMFPHLALVDVEDLAHPRYLVVGSALVRLLGRDPTYMQLERVYRRDVFEEIRGCFARAVTEIRPLMYRREFQLLGKSLGYDRLVLPLRQGGPVSRILIALYPIDGSLRMASQWMAFLRVQQDEDDRERSFAGRWAADVGARAVPIRDPGARGTRKDPV